MDARSTLRAAVEELAHDMSGVRIRRSTTIDQAMPYADRASVDAWLASQLEDVTLPTLLNDVLTAHLTADEQRRYEQALLTHPGVVDHLNRKAVTLAVADYLATEADKLLDDGPTDDEVYQNYAAEVADPLRDDLRALAASTRPW